VKRRAFIAGLGGVAAWPVVALPQQAPPVVGFLSPGLPEPSTFLVAAFREGLSEHGYFEGKNVIVEYRWERVTMIDSKALRLTWSGKTWP
jgi:putative ABC transport system substrate-binding protein